MSFPHSFSPNPSIVIDGPRGERAHADHLAQTVRLERKLWKVRDGVWCLVGNGLSNQTFIEGPEGLIAIDTGECVEEMTAAIAAVRAETDTPIVATIYTHFHYVSGTRAILDAEGIDADGLPIWGHDRIVDNLVRYGMEIGAAGGRGLTHQFGLPLPAEGPDGVSNVGLGLAYRSADHAPFTGGFIPPTNTITEPTTATIAGLEVVMTPAPSDADDSITIWFPDLDVCVNNLVWPTLFNIFAIRGEEYRDPRILLTGIDHIASLQPEHLVCTHGPPMSGRDQIANDVVDYRDSIAFLWDQTVRGINRGLTMDELTEFVQLPDRFGRSYLTQQLYGLVEHHVRQIHTGLRGWFDGNEASLFPLPHIERHQRLIEGFGGRQAVMTQARAALNESDLRWALELATWLVRSKADAHGRADGGTADERAQLGAVLRTIAQRTTSANVRSWCLTRAHELEGLIDLSRHRVHRFGAGMVMANPPASSVHALRVVLDPPACANIEMEVRWDFADSGMKSTGLRIRRGVAIPTDGASASVTLQLSQLTWATILGGRLSLADALSNGDAATNDPAALSEFFSCFDLQSLKPQINL